MSVAKAQIRNEVLEDLAVVAAGETPSAADASRVDSAIERLNEELVADGISYWATSAVPDDVVEPFKAIVAFRVAKAFEVDVQLRAELRSEATPAYTRLVALTAKRDTTGEPIRAEYF